MIDHALPKMHQGFSLLEMMVCISIMAILGSFSVQNFDRHIAQMKLQEIAFVFIADAQLARQYSRAFQTEVSMRPLQFNDWGTGWQILRRHSHQHQEMTTLKVYPLKNSLIKVPHESLKASQQFTDMTAPQKIRHLTFKNGQAAKLHSGGFVANRLIWQHSQYSDLIRHIILGPGGRWRICQPKEDNQACLAN